MEKIHVALLLMCKNEKKRLRVTLNSVIGYVDSIVAYDTGSTDNTIEILEEFSKKHNIPLRLKQGEFVDFSTSRNVSLEFADTFEDIDYLLLMDVNDELKAGSGDNLRKQVEYYKNDQATGFLLCQEWWCGQYDKYFNTRLVKARQGWRYIGSVHEYMKNTKFKSDEDAPAVVRLDDIILYQDRTQDDDKTSKRFIRDKEFLLKDYKENPNDSRTVFYLAQTCDCLHQYEEAFEYYKIRSTQKNGFWEEQFHAFLRAGDSLLKIGKASWYEVMPWYIQAYEHTPRAEPLIKIAEYYRIKNNWLLSYTFINLACLLKYPSHCILFVDKHAYDYKRWHILGIVGWYAGFYTEGKIGCVNAIKCGLNNELDTNNLKFYENRELQMIQTNEKNTHNQTYIETPVQVTPHPVQVTPPPVVRPPVEATPSSTKSETITKLQFVQKILPEILKKNPNLSRKQLIAKANTLWKQRNKV